MPVLLAAFSSELVKIAEDQKNKKPSYARAVMAGLPVVGMQALSDVPEGIIERSVETTIRQGRPSFRADLGALRFGSRIGAGALTTPIFLSGMKDLSTADTKRERRQGLAKVVAAGGIYAGTRGAIEGALDPDLAKIPLAKKVSRIAGPRTAMGVGGAAMTAMLVGKSLRDDRDPKNRTVWKSYVKPALIGAGLAGGKGAIEEVMIHGKPALMTSKGLRGVAAKAGGKAVAGAAATLFLSQLLKRVLAPKKEKTAAAENDPLTTSGMNTQASKWVQSASNEQLQKLYVDMRARGAEDSPSSRAVYYPLVDELKSRGFKTHDPQLRDKVHAPIKSGVPAAAIVGVAVAAPGLILDASQTLPDTARKQVLRDALDKLYLQDKIGIEHAYNGKAVKRGSEHAFPELNLIRVAKDSDPSVVAHEIGHVRSSLLRRETIGSPTARMVGTIGRHMSVIVPIYALFSSLDRSYATKEEIENKAKFVQVVGVAAAVAQAPLIAEEGVASIKGMHYLRRAGASSDELLQAAKTLGPAFATYAAPVAIPFLAVALMKRRIQDKKEG